MLEEYGNNKTEGLNRVLDFMDIPLSRRKLEKNQTNQIFNQAKQKPFLQKTKVLLDSFYQPYNKKLSELLDNDKWLYATKS